MESSDDPHEADSLIDERRQKHANRARKHEPGDVTPRPPLRGFASSEVVLSSPPPSLQSYHSAPYVAPIAAALFPPSVPGPSERPRFVVAPAPAPSPSPAVPAPRVGTTLHLVRSCASMKTHSCGHTCVPLDDRDDIVELDFAYTSAPTDVDASESRRLNSRNGEKR